MTEEEEVTAQKRQLPEYSQSSLTMPWISLFSITCMFWLNNYSEWYPACLPFQRIYTLAAKRFITWWLIALRCKGYLWLYSLSADTVCCVKLPWILLLCRTTQTVYCESFEASSHSAGSDTEKMPLTRLSAHLAERWFFILLGGNSRDNTSYALYRNELQAYWWDQYDCKKLELILQ